MTTMQAWRKVYGSLKDQTTVGLAHVNSDFKEVDVAIVKATNHVECPPKERHIRKILAYTSSNRPRADVQYCLHALARRLAKTQNWTVALKTLIVIHRTLRDGDPTFREELLNFQQRGLDLQLANFKDDSSPVAWDCSAWVLTYGLFLEERLECYRVLKYDIEAEQIPRPAQGQDNMGYSRTRDLESEELLEQLPSLQQLLYRLVGCRPEGAAVGNYLIQYALALVLKESFKIYCAVNDGIINLIVKFFEMPRHEAIKALDIYKRAGQQAAHLSDFYDVCNRLVIARNFKVIVLRELPQSFLATMEEYIREPLWLVTGPTQPLEFPERLMLTYKPEEDNSPHEEDAASPVEQPKSVPTDDFIDPNDVPEPTQSPPAPTFNSRVPDDLLGLNFDALNGSALAIVPFDTTSSVSGFQTKDFDPTGWELALVSNPSTNISSLQNRQLETEMSGLTSISINRPSIQSSLSDRSKPDPEPQARRISITTPPQPPSVPTGKQQIQKKPSVAEIERAIGAGMFKDRDINRDSEQEKTLLDQNLSTSVGKTEGDVEKKLRETGEWIIDQTEGPSRSTGMNILKVVFLWILSVWIILYLLVTFGLISINLDKLLSRGFLWTQPLYLTG